MSNKLQTLDAETLMNTPLIPIHFVVGNLISQGLHILAGSPKIGKSWLALWLCLQVSKGEPVWSFSSTKASVLYLCLEDSYARIQSRLFDLTDEAPPTLYFAIMSHRLGNGLEYQIEDFIKEHPHTGFIVIDTLQKIRDNTSATSNIYATDYQDISLLKTLADKHKIAILLIHHLRKTKDSDPLNMISGSSGISGATDTNFILQKDKRTEHTAKLICSGRDIQQLDLPLEFSTETYRWELLTELELEKRVVDESMLSLCNFIKSASTFTGTATDLTEALQKFSGLEYTPAVLKKKIVKHMKFLHDNGIRYADNRTYDKREFTLAYDGMTVASTP